MALGVFLGLIVACASAPVSRGVRWAPCTVAGAPGARCGAFTVPERWDTPGGRTIDLHLVVLPATGSRARDAIFVFQGGPGQAASQLADFYAETYRLARETRDIVLVDQRGTGGSRPLACDPGEEVLDRLAADVVRRCRATLEPAHDLTRYTTREAVRDAEAVRAALGYDTLDLYGTSYGTRVAQRYARTFPRRVRTMTLKGVVPNDSVLPIGFATDTERALGLLLDDCEADSACKTAHPELRRELAALRARLAQSPVEVTAEGRPVTLTPGRVAALFRSLLQSTSSAADLPRLIHHASGGDWGEVATQALALGRLAAKGISTGMFLSVACSEDTPFATAEAIAADTRGTFLGSYWADQMAGACREWPRAASDPEARRPLEADVPTLLISGFLDPATPPRYAERVARTLPRSRQIVVRYGSHSFAGLAGCVDRLMSDFVVNADPDRLDASCVEAIARPPWR